MKTMKFRKYTYKSYFPKEELKVVKNEFPELYRLLKRGELLECTDCPNNHRQYLYSNRLNTYLKRNGTKLCESSYLSNIDNFLLVFGERMKVEKMYNKRIVVKGDVEIYDLKTDNAHIPIFLFYENGKMVCPGSG